MMDSNIVGSDISLPDFVSNAQLLGLLKTDEGVAQSSPFNS